MAQKTGKIIALAGKTRSFFVQPAPSTNEKAAALKHRGCGYFQSALTYQDLLSFSVTVR